MPQREELQKLTDCMLDCLKEIDDCFTRTKTTGYEADFSTELKPFVDKVHQVAEEWQELAWKWVLKNSPRHLFYQQIEACAENIKQISTEAFYPTTDTRRFKQYRNSVHYILEKLRSELERDAVDQAPN